MLGRPLPWRKLGFSSLLDLVTKMPEVVRAETLPYVSACRDLVTGVATDR